MNERAAVSCWDLKKNSDRYGLCSGIGKARAEHFREEGALVCIFDIKGSEGRYEADIAKEDMIVSAVKDVRSLIKTLEEKGYNVNSEELDFEKEYQVIIKIGK